MPQIIYVVRMDHRTNSPYVSIQHYATSFLTETERLPSGTS